MLSQYLTYKMLLLRDWETYYGSDETPTNYISTTYSEVLSVSDDNIYVKNCIFKEIDNPSGPGGSIYITEESNPIDSLIEQTVVYTCSTGDGGIVYIDLENGNSIFNQFAAFGCTGTSDATNLAVIHSKTGDEINLRNEQYEILLAENGNVDSDHFGIVLVRNGVVKARNYNISANTAYSVVSLCGSYISSYTENSTIDFSYATIALNRVINSGCILTLQTNSSSPPSEILAVIDSIVVTNNTIVERDTFTIYLLCSTHLTNSYITNYNNSIICVANSTSSQYILTTENCIINTQFQSRNNDISIGGRSDFTYVEATTLNTYYAYHLKVKEIIGYSVQVYSVNDSSASYESLEDHSDISPIEESSEDEDLILSPSESDNSLSEIDEQPNSSLNEDE